LVGKDILELLSSSMHVEPMAIYREYVQNAADAIDDARVLGILPPHTPGWVEVNVDLSARSVRVRDNGTGVPTDDFEARLTAFGASVKRGSQARGLRGVGRLAGIGYCQELIFRARAVGESRINELRWDCRTIKSSLRSSDFKGDLTALVNQATAVRVVDGKGWPEHFFEVELRGILRHRNDCLLNAIAIRDYLSQIAPVPFIPSFRYGEKIALALSSHVGLSNLKLSVDGISQPVFRPHRDRIEIADGVFDRFTEIEFVRVPGLDGSLAAVGWVLHHGYRGAIPRKTKLRGLRMRSGNIQVGDHQILEELFPEPRFNGWAVGEIHVVDSRIVPNGRRDHYEQNVHLHNIFNQLSPLAREISRRCRTSSTTRNWLREFGRERANAKETIRIIKQGGVGATHRARLIGEIRQALATMEKVAARPALASQAKRKLYPKICRLQKEFAGILRAEYKNKSLARMPSHLRRAYEQVLSLVYECSPNRAAAKSLVDKILVRLGRKFG
jgi:Histidine kinase-, DNA gyrase B-, and HSP90-like ATPase